METIYNKSRKGCTDANGVIDDNHQALIPFKTGITYLQNCLLDNNFTIIKINFKFSYAIEKIIYEGIKNYYKDLLEIYESIIKENDSQSKLLLEELNNCKEQNKLLINELKEIKDKLLRNNIK